MTPNLKSKVSSKQTTDFSLLCENKEFYNIILFCFVNIMSRKNYTEREKRELLSIVDKYKAIIENKCTNAVTVEKKNETWEKIAREYNSTAENPRTAKQLNTAYQNLKRLTRQKVADDNKQNYKDKKLQNDLKQFKKDKAEDKKAIMATGGGNFKPLLSEVGAQMLALMGDQVKPLDNDCDSAADYFRKDQGSNLMEENNIVIVEEFDYEKVVLGELLEEGREPPLEEGREPQLEEGREPPLLHTPKLQKKTTRTAVSSHIKNRQHLKQKKNPVNTNTIKKMFYKKKLEIALIEKRTSMVNYRITLKKEKLVDMEIKLKEMEFSKTE